VTASPDTKTPTTATAAGAMSGTEIATASGKEEMAIEPAITSGTTATTPTTDAMTTDRVTIGAMTRGAGREAATEGYSTSEAVDGRTAVIMGRGFNGMEGIMTGTA
jgi:hypothetical protein